jgi:hypothetical protein
MNELERQNLMGLILRNIRSTKPPSWRAVKSDAMFEAEEFFAHKDGTPALATNSANFKIHGTITGRISFSLEE